MARKRTAPADYFQQVDELLTSTWGLDHGPAKIAVLEEVVRIADAHNDADLGFETRLELIDATTFGGAPDVAMVAFAWCLAQVDKDPERYDTFGLLWKYKWILDSAPEFPTIARTQITDMVADMKRRYKAAGSGMHPVHQTARFVYMTMGDLKAARSAHKNVLKSRHTDLSNCAACEQDAQVKFYLDTGRTALAFRKAEPLVNGRMRCAEVPHITYANLLLPLFFAGETEKAAEYHQKGTRMIGANPKHVPQASRHLIYLTVTGNFSAAARYLEKHLANGLATTCPAWRFEFDRAATFLFDCLSEQSKAPRVRLPATMTLPDAVDPTDPASLRDHFAASARQVANVFDTRNGNDYFSGRLAELDDLKKRVVAN